MTDDELREAARGNIEANADWTEDASPDEIADCVYTLAIDKLLDLGVHHLKAVEIANELAQGYANP
jgi:hypothetical protein